MVAGGKFAHRKQELRTTFQIIMWLKYITGKCALLSVNRPHKVSLCKTFTFGEYKAIPI